MSGLETGCVVVGVAFEGSDFLLVAEVLPLGEAVVANAVGDFVDGVNASGGGSGLELFGRVKEEAGWIPQMV